MTTDNPHDALFKAVFGQPENASGALRAVVPAALRDAVDWDTLSREPGSFVDAELTQRHTDLLFSASLRDGHEALLYVLFEHQSSAHPLMPYRLLQYTVRIWEQWIAEHPGATKLPAIVPVVLYHGHARWNAPRSLAELLDLPPELAASSPPYLPQLSFVLDDLSDVSDEDLRRRAASAAVSAACTAALVCFKHGRAPADMVDVLANWTDILKQVVDAPNGLDALEQLMRYIMLVNDRLRPARLHAMLEREVSSDAKETAMTVGQQLIEQGFRAGIEQGERALLLRLLRARFGDAIDATVEALVERASSERLERWGERMLSAESLADVLAD